MLSGYVRIKIGQESLAIDGIRIWSRPGRMTRREQTAKRTGTIDTTNGE